MSLNPMESRKTYVISLGGSIIVPNGDVDTSFLKLWKAFIMRRVKKGDRFVIITGGGGVARTYQKAARSVTKLTRDDLDWLGIHATRMNAHLMRTVLRDVARPVICKNPARVKMSLKYPVTIAAGWKPGWSTDYVAVKIAKRIKADLVINLSNIDYVYDKDPSKYKSAKRIEEISWKEFRKIVGEEWEPGMNAPFDPVASKLAHNAGLSVVIANGKDLKNLGNILDCKKFKGTSVRN